MPQKSPAQINIHLEGRNQYFRKKKRKKNQKKPGNGKKIVEDTAVMTYFHKAHTLQVK